MILHFATSDWSTVLPLLLRVWPEPGSRWTKEGAKHLALVAKRYGKPKADPETVAVSTAVDRTQLTQAGRRVAVQYSTPWKFQKFLNPSTPINKQAIKLRPGSELGISLEGHPTTARVETIRRIRFRGKWNYLKACLIINTETIPFYLDRETKCDCRFCGTSPRGDEESCRSCGAPLPDC